MPPSLPRIAVDVLRGGEEHRYAEHRWARAELHLPAGPGPHPVVVVLHGGSWRTTYGKRVMRPVCRDLVRHGWAAWNVEYRRVGGTEGGGWPATFEDVAAAVDHLATRRRAAATSTRVALRRSQRGRAPGAVGRRPRAAPRRRAGRRCARVRAGARDRPGPGRQPRARARADRRRAGVVNALLGGTPQQVPGALRARQPAAPGRAHRDPDAPGPRRGRPHRAGRPEHRVRAGGAAPPGAPRRARCAGDAAHRDHVDPRSVAWRVALDRLARA